MMTEKRWFIGHLARIADLSTKTVRYYESLGLLGEPKRTAAGYRTYGPEDLDRLRVIQDSKILGLSLTKIGQILRIRDSGERASGEVLHLLETTVEELDRKIDRMMRFRVELVALKEDLER